VEIGEKMPDCETKIMELSKLEKAANMVEFEVDNK